MSWNRERRIAAVGPGKKRPRVGQRAVSDTKNARAISWTVWPCSRSDPDQRLGRRACPAPQFTTALLTVLVRLIPSSGFDPVRSTITGWPSAGALSVARCTGRSSGWFSNVIR